MKQALKTVLVIGLCLCGLSKASSQQTWYVGTPTTMDITATLSADGLTLTLAGTGAMMDYADQFTLAPWDAYRYTIENLIIGNGITRIGNYAFAHFYALTSANLTIPNTITEIGNKAFMFCTGLTTVSIPGSVIDIGERAFDNCWGLTSISIPNSVETIGIGAFYFCYGASSITIGNSVKSIGNHAFGSCENMGFTSVVIPNTVKTIGEGAFSVCKYLRSITIGDSVTIIGKQAFRYCDSLTSIVIPDQVTSIGGYAFASCPSLYSVLIPNSVITIGEMAFQACPSLDTLTLPHSITSIGMHAFAYSGLNSMTLPPSLTSIEEGLFIGCSDLQSVIIPNSIDTIKKDAFRSCANLDSINLPDSIVFIDEWAFGYCSDLTTLTIPSAVTSIGSNAFRDCIGLNEVKVCAVIPPTLHTDVFSGVPVTDLHVPCGRETDYANAPTSVPGGSAWSDFNNIIGDVPFAITITATDTNGTVSLYKPDACTADITATPKPNYRFLQWSDGSTDSSRQITLICDTSLTAAFEQYIFNVELLTDAPHAGDLLGGGECLKDSSRIIIATPRTGYRFVSWSDGVQDSLRTVVVTSDTSFRAIFIAVYQLTVQSNDLTMGNVSGGGIYDSLSMATILAVPNVGYQFLSWQDGSTDSLRTFSVTSSMTYTATFELGNGIVETEDVTFSVRIYPNPACGKITISLPTIAIHTVFSLYDLQGKTLLKQNINNQDVILVGGLTEGIYLYSISVDGKNQHGKLSIIK